MKTSDPYVRWFKKHKNGVNGTICICVALVLLVSLAVLKSKMASSNPMLPLSVIIIAVYAFVRGVFTIVFDFRENNFGVPVYQNIRIALYNQLFFVYERMLWIWFILPVIIVGVLVFIEDLEMRKWVVIMVGSIELLLLALFSKRLLQKHRKLRNKINRIEQDLVEKNASS